MKKIIVAVLSLCIILTGCSGNKADNKQTTKVNEVKKEQSKEETTGEIKEYKIGDKIILDEITEITITKIGYTEERNKYSSKAKKVLEVIFDTKNLSNKVTLALTAKFKLFINGKEVRTYSLEKINKEHKLGIEYNEVFKSRRQGFRVDEEGPMELEVGYYHMTETKPQRFKIQVK